MLYPPPPTRLMHLELTAAGGQITCGYKHTCALVPLFEQKFIGACIIGIDLLLQIIEFLIYEIFGLAPYASTGRRLIYIITIINCI